MNITSVCGSLVGRSDHCQREEWAGVQRLAILLLPLGLFSVLSAGTAAAASPCDSAAYPNQCALFSSATLPPFVQDAIVSKGGSLGAGDVLVLSSGDPNDPDNEISNDMMQNGCGTNPDGWQTYDCNLLDNFVPAQDSVVLALSSEWFEWYQSIFTDWMTISAGGVPTVDVSINSWINNKVDIIPYGPLETGVVILTSLSKEKMVNFRVADSGDHIYDTAIVVVPATWFGAISGTNQDTTLLCGDGKLDPGEECDDGNSVTDDGCSSICIGTQPPSPPNPQTCGNLVYLWPTGSTAPYTCGADLCAGYRCVLGTTISPACYTAEQCAPACAGTCVDIPTAQLDCSTMCSVQPPASEPPPVVPPTCNNLVYVWPDGSTLPYTCDDACAGQRCVIGTTISPACYTEGECAANCAETCVDVPTISCSALCDLADQVVAEQADPSCDPAVDTTPRLAANQKGPCLGNMEICKSSTSTWRLADDAWVPEDEQCNGIDDDCNGVADDMFVTCGDPGLCQNTVNTCDPNDPAVPVPCMTLPPPSPFEICNDNLDNECDGDADDGCECGDDECMPGETFANCPADCPPPANGTACDDGDFCTLGDAYVNGVCMSGPIVNTCDDGNACTTDETCDPSAGCSAVKLNCDDQDACTIDTCDPVAGCVNSADPDCENPDADGDDYTSIASGGTDCNDDDPAIHPGATELCNGVDDNCDAAIDEGFGVNVPCQSNPNDCDLVGDGTFVCAVDGLSAFCSAVTPPNPPGYGAVCTSAPNACGATASGTVGCDGLCSALTPPAADADGDGTPDCLDLCPADTGKIVPGVCGCGVADTDTDVDGWANCVDNCPTVSNPNQADANGNGIGDACEPVVSQACLNFELARPNGGAVNYPTQGGPLRGLNLPVMSVRGLSTPAGNGVVPRCIDCLLNFTTGNLIRTTASSWVFGAGGAIMLTGGIDLDDNGVSDVPAGSVLLNGTFVGDITVQRLGKSYKFAGGSFADTKHPALIAAYGLASDAAFLGSFNLGFYAAAIPPRTFASTLVVGSNVTNCSVVATDDVE